MKWGGGMERVKKETALKGGSSFAKARGGFQDDGEPGAHPWGPGVGVGPLP